MKNTLFILLVILGFCSCRSGESKAQEVQMVSINKIRPNDVVHDSLTTQQVEAIRIIQATFSEVYPLSLEETITNFKRDQHPDNEIAIWMQMSDAYTRYLASKKQEIRLETKKEIFKLLLSRSMMSEHESIATVNTTILNQSDAKEVLSYYTAKPIPISVSKQP